MREGEDARLPAIFSVSELPRAGGPGRVGLCRDPAPILYPMRGVEGRRDERSILLEVFFIIFCCYMNSGLPSYGIYNFSFNPSLPAVKLKKGYREKKHT